MNCMAGRQKKRLKLFCDFYAIATPKLLGKTNPEQRARLAPVFLDREELSTSPNLAESLRKALEESDFSIVVCSPEAAASRWVNEEVKVFKERGKAERILCLIVAGETLGAQRGLAPEIKCFPPPALLGTVVEGKHAT